MWIRRIWRRPLRAIRWPALGLAAAIMLLAGCGLSSQTPGNGTSSGSATPTATPGHVSVTTNKPQYAPSDTVAVTISNGLASDIVAADHQSNCTVVLIQRQDGQNWQPLNPCRVMTPTRLIPFGAGSTTPVQLQPPASAADHGWPSGTYRIAFSYRQQASFSAPATTVYSAQFTVA